MKKNYPCTERDEQIVITVYRLLMKHIGKNHRITRNALRLEVAGELEMEFIGINDRDVRLAIEYLRNKTVQGSLILSTSGNAGYWIAESLGEFTQCIDEDRRRAFSILVRIHKQEKTVRSLFIDQENLPLFNFVNCDDLEMTC